MKVGDLVRHKVLKTVGVVLRIKSWEALDDVAIVLYSDGEMYEHSHELEVLNEGR